MIWPYFRHLLIDRTYETYYTHYNGINFSLKMIEWYFLKEKKENDDLLTTFYNYILSYFQNQYKN